MFSTKTEILNRLRYIENRIDQIKDLINSLPSDPKPLNPLNSETHTNLEEGPPAPW